jgi:hypothetical protein
VEIKESKQDEKNTALQTYLFQISAEISPSQAGPPAQAKSASTPAQPATASTPAKKG